MERGKHIIAKLHPKLSEYFVPFLYYYLGHSSVGYLIISSVSLRFFFLCILFGLSEPCFLRGRIYIL